MEMIIDFPGGDRVDAHFGPYTVPTDQPTYGGGIPTSATPFATFLASIGTCAGIYVLGFCRQRGIATDGLRLIQRLDINRMTGMVTKIYLDIQLPAHFPEKYKQAVIRAADQCAVKKHLETPPQFEVIANLMPAVQTSQAAS